MTIDQPPRTEKSPPKPALFRQWLPGRAGGREKPASSPDFSRIEDSRLWEIIAGARRVRGFARSTGLLVAVAGWVVGGREWMIGALSGWLLVEINLGLLIRTLVRAPQWRGRSLWPTLISFYLIFGATAAACLVVIRNNWGHPLAFLLGLLTFFAGLILAIVSFIIKKPEPPAR